MPHRKELHFYGRDLAQLPSTLSEAEHRALFERAHGGELVGETCIWALYSANAAREIHEADPDARIVILLRNPVEMIHALHVEFLIYAIEDISDLGKALKAQQDRRLGKRLPRNGLYPAAIYAYQEIATFSVQLERYLRVFGPDRVHIILLEDLRKNFAGEFCGLLRFLGVDVAFTPHNRMINSSRRLRSAALQRVLLTSEMLTQGWWPRLLPVGRERLQRSAAALLQWNVREGQRPPFEPALRRRLLCELAAEIERLGNLLGRDLSHWCSPPGNFGARRSA
jgi:hypothetical protein